jgi:hypothetical protein
MVCWPIVVTTRLFELTVWPYFRRQTPTLLPLRSGTRVVRMLPYQVQRRNYHAIAVFGERGLFKECARIRQDFVRIVG